MPNRADPDVGPPSEGLGVRRTPTGRHRSITSAQLPSAHSYERSAKRSQAISGKGGSGRGGIVPRREAEGTRRPLAAKTANLEQGGGRRTERLATVQRSLLCTL